VCKRCEDLARRAADANDDIKIGGSRVEEVEIDGFAGEHAVSLLCDDDRKYTATGEDAVGTHPILVQPLHALPTPTPFPPYELPDRQRALDHLDEPVGAIPYQATLTALIESPRVCSPKIPT
jgi:hypothetical protein